jgi:hypothetical protein
MFFRRPNLKELDYMNFGKQYQIFQKLLAVYDVEPDNFPRYVFDCLCTVSVCVLVEFIYSNTILL